MGEVGNIAILFDLQTPRGSDPRLLQEVGDLFVNNINEL